MVFTSLFSCEVYAISIFLVSMLKISYFSLKSKKIARTSVNPGIILLRDLKIFLRIRSNFLIIFSQSLQFFCELCRVCKESSFSLYSYFFSFKIRDFCRKNLVSRELRAQKRLQKQIFFEMLRKTRKKLVKCGKYCEKPSNCLELAVCRRDSTAWKSKISGF